LLNILNKNMKNYPTIKTAIKGLVLQTLQNKHLPFLVSLLSNKEIQKTLFRVPTHISEEKEAKALDKMYNTSPPKEIMYILTLKSLLTETYLGYVTIKLIDWNVKSCYLSVAILPDSIFRGKGYAKACYDAFFEYLFSLGLMKIYGRTNETNIATIKLNEATGFRFIGRQTGFMLYPDNTSQDDLFFERLNPEINKKYSKILFNQQKKLLDIVTPLAEARRNNAVSRKLLETTLSALNAVDMTALAIPFQHFTKELIDGLTDELAVTGQPSQPTNDSKIEVLTQTLLAQNAIEQGLPLLVAPITNKQKEAVHVTCSNLMRIAQNNQLAAGETILTAPDLEKACTYGCYTPENWDYLRFLFLGKNVSNSTLAIIIAIQKYLKSL